MMQLAEERLNPAIPWVVGGKQAEAYKLHAPIASAAHFRLPSGAGWEAGLGQQTVITLHIPVISAEKL